MIAYAAHPALLLRMPARARTFRPDWQRTVTPVEIPEISAAEASAVDLPGLHTTRDAHPGPIALHDGRLWVPLAGAGRTATPADLVAVLEDAPLPGATGADAEDFRSDLVRAFVDTPLYLPYRGQPRDVTRWDANDRGGALGPHRMVRADRTLQAAAAIRDFARDDLLVIGGVPHLRLVPLARPHRLYAGRDTQRTFWEVGYHVMPYAGMAALMTGPVDPAGLEPARDAYLARHGEGPLRHPEAWRDWRALPPSVFGDRAAEAVANNLPGILRRAMEFERRGFPHLRGGQDTAVATRLAKLELEGLSRSWRGERIGDCLRACAEILAPLAEGVRGVPLTHFEDGCVTVLETLRAVHLPRYAAPKPDIEPDDAAAFAML